jgi:hypothetical protein
MIQIGVNHSELLNDLREQTDVAQSHGIRIKEGKKTDEGPTKKKAQSSHD